MPPVDSRPPSYDEARPFLADMPDEEKPSAPPPAPAVNLEADAEEDIAPVRAARPRRRRRLVAAIFVFIGVCWMATFGMMLKAVDEARQHGRQEMHDLITAAHGYPAGDDRLVQMVRESTTITRIQTEHPGAVASGGAPTHFEVCAKLESGSEVEIPVAVHHGGLFLADGSFSGVKELTYTRAGPVGIAPPHKPPPKEPPHEKPPHSPKLPIPGLPKPPASEKKAQVEGSLKPKPPKDHPSPYNVTVGVTRAKSKGTDVFVCAYKIGFVSVGVGAFGLVNETIHPLLPSKDARTISELAVKVTLPTGFPAAPIGLRAPIFPIRPVPAPPTDTLRITRVTTVVTQRLKAMKNRIASACRGRMMRHHHHKHN